MQQRLIDANALREEILTENYDNDTINNFLDLVDLSPTIDAEPVAHFKCSALHCKYCECSKGEKCYYKLPKPKMDEEQG